VGAPYVGTAISAHATASQPSLAQAKTLLSIALRQIDYDRTPLMGTVVLVLDSTFAGYKSGDMSLTVLKSLQSSPQKKSQTAKLLSNMRDALKALDTAQIYISTRIRM
jgi:hypothetical protein